MTIVRFKAQTGERPLTTNRAGKKHWSARHRNTNEWAAATQVGLREAKVRAKFDRVGFRFWPYYPPAKNAGADPRLPDADGLAPTCKAIVDACVAHGLIPDDSPAHVAYKHYAAATVDGRVEWPVIIVEIVPKVPVDGHRAGECTCRVDREQREAKAAIGRTR